MNIYQQVTEAVEAALREIPAIAEMRLPIRGEVSVELPRDKSHGDIATNCAMVWAKKAKMNPRELASQLCKTLSKNKLIASTEVAGPGFVNLWLVDCYWRDSLQEILRLGHQYGNSTIGAGHNINVEYISANPTGPLHAAHARGAVVGDSLALLLEKVGYKVCKEYYINDAGAQIEILARSVYLRYREALGEKIPDFPDGYYPGEYLIKLGENQAIKYGRRWLETEETDWLPHFRSISVEEMMRSIKKDLERMGINMNVFSSESDVVNSGGVHNVVKSLQEKDLIYTGVLNPPKGKKIDDWEARPQLLFRATEFGDDVDRPIQKSDGSWTYFATDIAYHLDKYRRGFGQMIDVWGADHGGYIKRMQSAVQAISDNLGTLDIKICQIVHMMDNGKPVRMSKRSGTFIALSDVIEAVGKDAIRFIMLTRRNDQALEFDLTKVTEQSRDNPVFYVQYAHARCCSVLRHAHESIAEQKLTRQFLSGINLDYLNDAHELKLIKRMAYWPRLVEAAAKSHEPHRIAFYLFDLASDFHALWNKGKDESSLRFLVPSEEPLTLARLALVRAVAIVVASGLSVIGVEPLEELRS